MYNKESLKKAEGLNRNSKYLMGNRISFWLPLVLLIGLFLGACDDDDPTGPDLDPDIEVEANISITPENPAIGDEVTLDAGNSTITEGEPEYSWTLNVPAGSEAELESETDEVTSFTVDAPGDYNIDLVVTANGVSDGASDLIEVTTQEEISSNITEDRTLTSEISYLVTDEIDIEAELTIEPGTTIEFESGTGFEVTEQAGAINSQGTEEDPILFTGTNEQSGWWNGIYFEDSSNQNNILDHVTIKYGGGEEYFRSGSGNVIIGRDNRDAAVEITNSTLQQSGNYGLWLHEEAEIRNFENNTITENDEAPVNIASGDVHVLGSSSSYAGNSEEYIYVRGGYDIDNEDVTWQALDVIYRLSSSGVEISNGNTLTIEPGVTIEFESDGRIHLDEQGGLSANGTEAEPILFTATNEQTGWWEGIYIEESSNANNQLNWVTVEYGGGEEYLRSGSGNVVIGRDNRDGSAIEITNSTLRHSESYGLWMRSTADLTEFDGNVITNNEEAPVNLAANNAHLLDGVNSSYSGNGEEYIYVRGGNDIESENTTWENLDVDYRVNSSSIVVRDAVTLTIEPGVTLEFESGSGVQLDEEGGLSAEGTEEEPILFTATTEQPGWWDGIYIEESSNANNQLNWVTVEYGGGDEYLRSGSGNVVLGRDNRNASAIDVTNSVLRHSESYGIWVNDNSTANDDVCDVNTFENNSNDDCLIN